jgi:hypothetical protein
VGEACAKKQLQELQEAPSFVSGRGTCLFDSQSLRPNRIQVKFHDVDNCVWACFDEPGALTGACDPFPGDVSL